MLPRISLGRLLLKWHGGQRNLSSLRICIAVVFSNCLHYVMELRWYKYQNENGVVLPHNKLSGTSSTKAPCLHHCSCLLSFCVSCTTLLQCRRSAPTVACLPTRLSLMEACILEKEE